MERQLDKLTLPNKLNETDRMVRELEDHLERGFIPKAHLLRRVARKGNDPSECQGITDITVRSNVQQVLEADDFSVRLSNQINEFLTSIETDLNQIIGN